MGNEIIEIIIMAVDKVNQTKNWETASQTIKNTLDKKFDSGWQVVVGEGFCCQIGREKGYCLHILYGFTSILCFK